MNIINWLFQPNICQATDPWAGMANTVTTQMPDIMAFFTTPITFIISVLCICLVLSVIIKSTHH